MNLQQSINSSDQHFDQAYWDNRWESNNTDWDTGQPSPAITEYMAQHTNKHVAILVPGCGNAYEAQYLAANGFTNITLVDIAPSAVEKLKLKFENIPEVRTLCEDFFTHQGQYDIIIEQTFFCAIHPSKRKNYVQQSAQLLKNNGRIIGVLFNRFFQREGPPFGGNISDYQLLFEPYFLLKTMDECYNSIKPRSGSEVFINLLKK